MWILLLTILLVLIGSGILVKGLEFKDSMCNSFKGGSIEDDVAITEEEFDLTEVEEIELENLSVAAGLKGKAVAIEDTSVDLNKVTIESIVDLVE